MTEADLPERPELENSDFDAARMDQQNSGSMAGGQQGAAGDGNVQNQGDHNSINNTIYQLVFSKQSPSDTITRPNNEKMLLQDVRTQVADRLNTSLHQAVFINLPKDSQRQRVRRPWDTQIKVGNGEQQTLPPEMSIAEVFKRTEVGCKLLILGEPGAGKTTTLLDLAQGLIQAAEKKADQPIPVLFSLSSWKNTIKSDLRNQNSSNADATEWDSIALWIISELKSKYSVASKLARQWLNEKKLLPLLDGLDEVTPDDQADCLNAINQFLVGDIAPPGLTVCCREEEYELIAASANKKLKLNGAICLKPLTEIQLQEYLQETGNIQLWQPFHQDAMLLNLVKTPLWLSISILAINEFTINHWKQDDSLETRREQLLDAYARQMLHRYVESECYTTGKEPSAKQIREWLIVLAIQLQTQSQDEFFVENIQPSWIKSKQNKIIYKVLVGLYVGLMLLSILHEVKAMPIQLVLSFYPQISAIWLIALDQIIILTVGIATYIIFGEKKDIDVSEKIDFQISSFIYSLKKVVESNKSTIFFGWISLLCFMFCYTIWKVWSEQHGYRGIHYFIANVDGFVLLLLICALFSCLMVGLLFPFYLACNIPLAIIDSLKMSKIEIPQRPNQGIKDSIDLAQKAYFLGFAIMAISGFFLALFWTGLLSTADYMLTALNPEYISGSNHIPNKALYVVRSIIGAGNIGGLVVAQAVMIPYIRHFALRYILYRQGSTPWDYVRFLNYCTDRLLLQRVGGRYRFIHKLLQEHFANMPLEK